MKAILPFLFISLVSVTTAASPLAGTSRILSTTIGRDMEQSYDVVLREKEVSVFSIKGDGRSDLDCFIFDEQKIAIVKDEDEGDVCYLTVTPKWSGHFFFVVKNRGPAPDTYSGSVQ